tara:strand:- start:1350 stop:1934 length:585 start_codon:yes stop_codon:yes gene_type:complete
MYFPKSKIETNLYSDGEFQLRSTGKIYYGLYFKTSNNEYFTNAEPSDTSVPLLPLDVSSDALDSREDYDLRFVGEQNYRYSVASSQPIKPPLKLEPIPYYPIINQETYKLGKFNRYFTKRKNENLYYEIDFSNSVELLRNPMYLIFSFPWIISGEEQDVISANKSTVDTYMRQLQIPAFNLFLKDNYIKFWKPS